MVGGAVRDILLQLPIHDLDIEVHSISSDDLEKILSDFGTVHFDGKSFGVLRINSLPVDWSLPRRDSSGRKPVVEVDPTMDITQALKRRDLTMNAMAIDLATGELIDPFNGYADLQNKVLATPDQIFFMQDPLRFYRVMQFIGRFEMQPNRELDIICTSMDISTVSIERIHAEFNKLLMLSKRPSLSIYWLKNIGRLKEVLPELAATIGIEQEPSWHPEGDVFEHTMQALDAAAALSGADSLTHKLICYAALCHDLGKVTTTRIIDGRLRSLGHEQAGVAPARALCKRLTGNKKLIDHVALLVRHHMAPAQLISQNASAKAYKKLAKALAPDLNLYMLAQLAYADKLGRNPARCGPLTGILPAIDQFILKAQEYGVLYGPEKQIITGADLIPLGFEGPALGRALEQVYEHQIKEKKPSKETLLRYAQRMLK
ncbi:MAG: HD domain-containing protein [Candidatus Babeliaceae bacterium]|nr:HD domain-containing protein [Candidatus Babeliaceae bacterium]